MKKPYRLFVGFEKAGWRLPVSMGKLEQIQEGKPVHSNIAL